MDELYDLEVNTKQDFEKFVMLLYKDFQEKGNEWENNTLERFLEALSAYAEDIQGYYNNTGQYINSTEPSWRVFADILKGAKIYE